MQYHAKIVACFLLCIALFLSAVPAKAQTNSLDAAEKALAMITKTATNICLTAPLHGKSVTVEVSGEAKAELNNLLRKLANIGFTGGVKYQTEEYSGFLRSQLAGSFKDSNDCRRHIFDSLKDKLLEQAIPKEANSQAGVRSASADGSYGNTKCYAKADENGSSAGCKQGSQ